MKLLKSKYIIIFVLLIQFGVLFSFAGMKKGMHFDECFSYFNTNNSGGRQAYDREFVSSEEIMQDFYVKPGEQFNYPYVILLQSYDVHPPVFYLLLHTLCSFMPGVFSLWQGLGLNILYSLLSTFFIFLIIKEFSSSNLTAACLSLLIALNPGTINNMLYIRMYCLMTLWIILAIYLHLRMCHYEDFNHIPLRFYFLNAALTFVGFLTHYFYLVFLFFIEAGYLLWRLLSNRTIRLKDRLVGVLKYGAAILLSGIIGVLVYPSCLGHVNSGYRGVEVKSYLFDLSDFGTRFSFFNQYIDRYVFNGFMYVSLLIAVLLCIAMYYTRKRTGERIGHVSEFVFCILIPTLGYYLVSVKSSLLGDEAMMRYQLPIYPLILLITMLVIYRAAKAVVKSPKFFNMLAALLALIFLGLNVYSLANKQVFYLYEDQERMLECAREHANEGCVYIYHNEAQKYLLWNDAMQLKEFDRVYFVNSENTQKLEEPLICDADRLFVYISTLDQNKDISYYEDLIYSSNPNIKGCHYIYDAMYATAYEFE